MASHFASPNQAVTNAAVLQLVQLLATINVGEMVSYELLAAAAGMEIRPGSPGYVILRKAFKEMLDLPPGKAASFEVIYGVGYLRQDTNGVLRRGQATRRLVKRRIKKTLRHLHGVARDGLTNSQSAWIDIELTSMAAIQTAAAEPAKPVLSANPSPIAEVRRSQFAAASRKKSPVSP